MLASPLEKLERISQVWLDDAIEAHDAFLRAIPGGMRLFLSFKDGRHLDFSGQNLTGADLRGTPMELADTRGAGGLRKQSA